MYIKTNWKTEPQIIYEKQVFFKHLYQKTLPILQSNFF